MADSPFPRVAALSGGLVCASLLAAYVGLGASLARPETTVLSGVPDATRRQADELYSSVRWQPWNSSEYLRLGMFFLANGRPAPAVEWLHRATVWNAGGYQAWYYLGLAWKASHRVSDAHAAFLRVLQLNPDYVAARVQLANLLLDEGRFHEAAQAYLDLRTTGADKVRTAQGLGTALLREGNYRDAEPAFRQALARFSAYGDAHAGLAAALKGLGEDEHAAREAKLARNWRGVVPLRTDDPLTEQMEHDFPTGLSLFQSAVRNRDPRTSIDIMEKALALDPSMTFGWEYMISLYGQAHRPKDAERAYNSLRKLDYGTTRGRYELAVVLAQAGDHAKAGTLLNDALTLDPAYSEAHRMLGAVVQLDGNRDEAVRQFRAALAGDPGLAEAHVDLGMLLLKGGQTKEGEAELLRALVPPCEQPDRTLTRELLALRDDPIEGDYEKAVRAQATERNQLSLITLLNNRKKPQAAKPIGLPGLLNQAPGR